MAYDLVIFDCDGVLVDSEPLWTIAETELAALLSRSSRAASVPLPEASLEGAS